MLGRIWLGFRRKFGKGLRVAYYRDVVRPRILETKPVTGLDDDRCELHVLTSHDDWLNLVWALKSFYRTSGRRYRLCIHDDGSLGPSSSARLRDHFPDARLIERTRADAEVLPTLAEFPRCRAFRESNQLSPKLFDFRHYLESERMLLLDSDVLFFSEPTELLRRIEDEDYRKNTVNSDFGSAYTVDPQTARIHAGVALVPCFNSGAGLIQRDSLRLDWMEEFLGLPGISGHFWRIEQTLYALLSSRFGVELLPPEYTLYLARGLSHRSFRHYVGRIRHLMYGEGIRELVRHGMLADLAIRSQPV